MKVKTVQAHERDFDSELARVLNNPPVKHFVQDVHVYALISEYGVRFCATVIYGEIPTT